MGNKISQFGKTSVYKIENESNIENVVETQEPLNVRYGYYKNKKNVFYDGISLKLSKSQLKTFEKLKYGYAKTRKLVFYNGEKINQANPKTFIVINRKNIPDQFKNLNSVIGMDFDNNFKRIYQFGKIIYTIKL
jgi:hypothetical protein